MITHCKALASEDRKIESLNKKLRVSQAALEKADTRLLRAQDHLAHNPSNEKTKQDLAKAVKAQSNAKASFAKAVEGGVNNIGMGSGRVMILLPTGIVPKTN